MQIMSKNDDVDKEFESNVGLGGTSGLCGNRVGEASNIGWSEELDESLSLFDVKLGKIDDETKFEDVIEDERTSVFEVAKGEAKIAFEGEEICDFEVAKGKAKTTFEGEAADAFLGETEGVTKVQNEDSQYLT
ncbi:hypothetical protein V6N13_043097 [Hibiscus sabdariffa]|uniref:Uncharacterized protein n=1 Tax=Hibiscus sabdariffa TaxID=183260 RepID=A0ABR2G2S2_9ROSI